MSQLNGCFAQFVFSIVDFENYMAYECIFAVAASTASLVFGIGAPWMFKIDPKAWGVWEWVRQFWLNYFGSMVGWLCCWLLVGRVESWISGGYQNAPGIWEIFLFIVAFVGMTGHLPLASVLLIEDLSRWSRQMLENAQKKETL